MKASRLKHAPTWGVASDVQVPGFSLTLNALLASDARINKCLDGMVNDVPYIIMTFSYGADAKEVPWRSGFVVFLSFLFIFEAGPICFVCFLLLSR